MTEFGHHKVVDWLEPGVLSLPVVEGQVSPDYLARVQQVLAAAAVATFAVEAKELFVLQSFQRNELVQKAVLA